MQSLPFPSGTLQDQDRYCLTELDLTTAVPLLYNTLLHHTKEVHTDSFFCLRTS